MNGILLIVRRSLRQHALSTLVTILSVALATGLVMSVFCVRDQAHEAFTGGSIGFDAVLGARGSQLQLVLNTVFHLETSPGNIPWKYYQAVKNDPRVKLAVPYAVGDNLRGFRIVGTTAEIFTEFEYQEGKKLTPEPGGRIFIEPTKDKKAEREGVIGSYVAQKLDLKVGDTFKPFHGLYFDEKTQHEEVFKIVGILQPTNTPNDRVIWIPIDWMYRMKGHVFKEKKETAKPDVNPLKGDAVIEHEPVAGEEIPDEHKEVSAVMIKLKSPVSGMGMRQQVNIQGKEMTLAFPIAESLNDLFNKIGWIDKVLELIAYLVVLVSAGSILASIYNTMNERRREFAILRALGARRGTVFSAIVAEAAVIAGLGSLVGYLIHAAILSGAAYVIRKNTGVVLDVFQLHPVLALAPLGMTVLGALSGVAPAFKAYGTDVATNLTPVS